LAEEDIRIVLGGLLGEEHNSEQSRFPPSSNRYDPRLDVALYISVQRNGCCLSKRRHFSMSAAKRVGISVRQRQRMHQAQRLPTRCAQLAVARVFVSLGLMVGIADAVAQSPRTMVADQPRSFEIPARPLSEALEAFSSISGYQILLADEESARVISRSVKGVFAPRAALGEMIDGSGLVARFTSQQAAVLVRDVARGTIPVRPEQQLYDARLQSDIMNALCRNAFTRPGQFRLAVDVWAASSGRLDRVELLSSTGDADHDQAIVAVLIAMRSPRPPLGLEQPTTLLLSSSSPGDARACESWQKASVP
jgi:hypothetical protein